MAFARIPSFLRPGARKGRAASTSTPPRPEGLRRGTRIGGYLIGAKLSVGSGSVLYEARSPDGHLFALKMARHRPGVPGSPDSLMDERFQRATFCHQHFSRHPNVLQLYAFDRHPDPLRGCLFQVLEWTPGTQSITRWVRRAHPSLEQIISAFKQLALVCADLHAKGMRHRDLRPETIVVTPAGVPKILDFHSASCRHRKKLTPPAAGSQPCAVECLPPELCTAILDQQRTGLVKPFAFKPGADLHALGAVFYEVLTGRHPFNLELEGDDLLREIATRVPRPPRAFNPDVPSGLEEIVMTLLAKEPRRRYELGETVAAELEMLERMSAGPGWSIPFEVPGWEWTIRPLGPGPLEAPATPRPAAPDLPPQGAPAARPRPVRRAVRLAAAAILGALLLPATCALI
jgi:serine/threonine-protein kinase